MNPTCVYSLIKGSIKNKNKRSFSLMKKELKPTKAMLPIDNDTNVDIAHTQPNSEELTKTIIVFGDKGSGKTSIIDLLCLSDGPPLPNPSEEETQINPNDEDFTFRLRHSQHYTFMEVVGVGSGSSTQGSTRSKFCNLRNIIKYLENHGVYLLIFVVRKGRISKSMEENYNIFTNGVCLGQVPVLILVTHCENDAELEYWWKGNETIFSNYGMKWTKSISICPVSPASIEGELHPTFAKVMKDVYEKSRLKLPQALVESLSDTGFRTDTWKNWLKAVKNSFWNLYWSAEMK